MRDLTQILLCGAMLWFLYPHDSHDNLGESWMWQKGYDTVKECQADVTARNLNGGSVIATCFPSNFNPNKN